MLAGRESIIPTDIRNSYEPSSSTSTNIDNTEREQLSGSVEEENVERQESDNENQENITNDQENYAQDNNVASTNKRMSKDTAFAELLKQIQTQNPDLSKSAREDRALMERFLQANEAAQASERAKTEALTRFLDK